jgi:hypothetical protein
MGGMCSTHGGDNAYKILIVKPEGNGLLGRPERRRVILKWILGKYGLGGGGL